MGEELRHVQMNRCIMDILGERSRQQYKMVMRWRATQQTPNFQTKEMAKTIFIL